MNKKLMMGAAIATVFAMTSCKSSESAYKKAYEKAKANQEAAVTATEVTPVQKQETVQVTPVETVDYSNVAVRTENVTVVTGNPLKAYSVVVGSFSVQSNANALSNTLAGKGYAPRVVKAVVNGADWFRVIATSYDTKAEAAQSRAALESQYAGAWLLYQK